MARDQERAGPAVMAESILYSKQDGSVHFSLDNSGDVKREAAVHVHVHHAENYPTGHGHTVLYSKQDGSVHFSPDSSCDAAREATACVDIAVEKPGASLDRKWCGRPAQVVGFGGGLASKRRLCGDLEAYSGRLGSWWDVEILQSTSHNKYLKVHYVGFSKQEDEWIPVTHLRMRSRPCEYSHEYCNEIYPGIDVSVMTRHPNSEDDSEVMWFDARIIDIKRKPHHSNTCACSFWISLYEIPKRLPRDWSRRKLLPASPTPVALKDVTTMREASTASFEEIIAASLPDAATTSPQIIWVKDGACWYSSLQSSRPVFQISHDLDEFADYLERLLLSCRKYFRLPEENRARKVFSSTHHERPAVGIAVPKSDNIIAKEITYAELFIKSMDLVQCTNNDLDEDSEDESGLLPSWNPFEMQPVAPAPAVLDPFADVWEDMRAALQSIQGNGEIEANTVDDQSLKFDGKGENVGRSECLQHHTVTFDQAVGEVCGVCGFVLLGLQNMWVHDNVKRTPTAEGDGENLEDNDDSFDYEFASVWDDSNADKTNELSNTEGGLMFELIPNLAKHMQRHQKEGFQFLWCNLTGQDSNKKYRTCSPHREPGGCILSHAPGTGKTFLIISFLQSYMKKHPDCRPLIVAPKIMLQPWEKEFQKWNVDIPVYNFDGEAARERGKTIFQQHMAAGVVQFDVTPNKNMLGVCREAMLFEWLNAPSVLVISYQTFSSLTLGDASMLGIKRMLLERSSVVVLDEGHYARNNLSQVKEQLMAIRTPLRVMLSGTLFQNNFEELYTCLNLVRPGFVQAFADTAGLKFHVLQREADQIAEAQAAKKWFIEEVGNKIDRGQQARSSPECLSQGLTLLRQLTSPFVHHYTGGVLQRQLPPLREFVIVLQPGALQASMITKVAELMHDKSNLEREGLLSLACIHPSLLSKHTVAHLALPPDPALGVKTRFVMSLLERLHHREERERTLIFCMNLDPLVLLGKMLETHFGWVGNRDVLQIDGKVAADERQSIIERFNDPRGAARVLLLSTRACGEGVTLTGASRVVFMDVLWNPAVRRQAIHRAFRIGQTRVVHVYCLVVEGSHEEDKYRTMVWKDWKSQTIFHSSDEDHEKVKKSAANGFWRVRKQCSKDAVLNELEREDAALDQPAFKHVFRHGGLFDDDECAPQGDPEGRSGTDARDWLRGIEGDMDCGGSADGALDMDMDTDDRFCS